MNVCQLRKIADLFAIPLFLFTILYFLAKKRLTHFEWILLFFAIGGLLADSVFAIEFLLHNTKC